MKKKILIYADNFNGKIGQTYAYMHFFSQFGNVDLVSTLSNLDNIVEKYDMLVIPGGADVDASLYGGIPGVHDSRVNQHYEFLDRILIPQFVESKKPIVGICRGMQRLNVFFGGDLIQDIAGHHQGENRVKANEILVVDSNFASDLGFDKNVFYTNTMHHQCVGAIGEGLIPVGFSKFYNGSPTNRMNELQTIHFPGEKNKKELYYGIVEVVIHESLPIIGFQYHPEEFNCKLAVSSINKLLEQ